MVAVENLVSKKFSTLMGDNAENTSIVILWWLFNLFDSKCSFGLRSLLGFTGRQTMDNFWDKNSATITKRFSPCALRTCWCKNFIDWLIQHFFYDISYQASDLRLLMQRYEYWAHRLFPKFPFVDVVEQVESLSAKKLVQVRWSLAFMGWLKVRLGFIFL